MIDMTKRPLGVILGTALLAGFTAGCSLTGGGDNDNDKAGGSRAPKVLTLAAADDADQPDAPFARYFASRVSKLSGGSLRVRVVWDAAGQDSPGYDLGIARLVRQGKFDLGWMGARAWDRMGVKQFQALQAPFLVTDHRLLGRITTGPLAGRMLAGLGDRDLVGLALVPERLRYLFGARRSLDSPAALEGARVRVRPSRATDALVRALGATPVHISGDGVGAAVAKGEIDGAEASLGTNSPEEGERHLTMNLPLFAKTLTLFAGQDAFDGLDDGDQAVIRKAATQTAAYAAAHPASESELVRDFCSEGGAVTAVAASPDAVAAMKEAARPVYAQLERDPETKALIASIRNLKRTAGVSAEAPPAGCEPHKVVASGGSAQRPSILNGTYHWRITRDGARAAVRIVGGSLNDEDIGTIGKMTLRDGKWLMGDVDPEEYSGTYAIQGRSLIFDWGGTKNTFRFTRDPDGTLRLRPVPPMDPGDAVVMTGGPWRRVGPPVREIP